MKVAIIGAGMVGATCAYAMMIKGVASDIVLVDINKEKAEGEIKDLNHGASFVRHVDITAGTYEDCAGADVIVVTAGAAQKPGETRLDLVNRNVKIFKSIIPELERVAPEAILLIASNPVDIMTYVTLKISNYPKERVIGSGTLLDSSRFRYLLSEHYSIDARNIHAYILGEHGDSEIPAWSIANVGGMSVADFCSQCVKNCGGLEREKIFHSTKNAAYEIIRAKGSTYYAIGLALVEIVQAILRDENSVMPVSCLLEGHLGISGVCLSVLAVVGRNGITNMLDLHLSDEEMAGLKKSADVLRKVIDEISVDTI